MSKYMARNLIISIGISIISFLCLYVKYLNKDNIISINPNPLVGFMIQTILLFGIVSSILKQYNIDAKLNLSIMMQIIAVIILYGILLVSPTLAGAIFIIYGTIFIVKLVKGLINQKRRDFLCAATYLAIGMIASLYLSIGGWEVA